MFYSTVNSIAKKNNFKSKTCTHSDRRSLLVDLDRRRSRLLVRLDRRCDVERLLERRAAPLPRRLLPRLLLRARRPPPPRRRSRERERERDEDDELFQGK